MSAASSVRVKHHFELGLLACACLLVVSFIAGALFRWSAVHYRNVRSLPATLPAAAFFSADQVPRENAIVFTHNSRERNGLLLDLEYTYTWVSGALLNEDEAAHVHRSLIGSAEEREYRGLPGWSNLYIVHTIWENYLRLYVESAITGVLFASLVTFFAYRVFLRHFMS